MLKKRIYFSTRQCNLHENILTNKEEMTSFIKVCRQSRKTFLFLFCFLLRSARRSLQTFLFLFCFFFFLIFLYRHLRLSISPLFRNQSR